MNQGESIVIKNKFTKSLDQIVERASHLKGLSKADLQFGDWIIITTQNSTYYFSVLDNGFYLVSGGLFDRMGLSPMRITISGCTWGGSVIKVDIVAAYGMSLEFGNHIVTSPIKEVRLIRCGSQN